MTDEHTLTDLRGEIDRRLETALESANAADVPAARAAVEAHGDRWHGRLLVRSHEAAVGQVDSGPVLSAAASVELLRGYCRLRSEQLRRVSEDVAREETRDPTASLLAGDHLYSVAYSVLGDSDHASVEACVETLASVSGAIVEAFASAHVRSTSPPASDCASIDGTVGALGEGAAVIGATLAGVGECHRDHFAALGRGLATARLIRRTLATEPGAVRLGTAEASEARLRRHAERRRREADRALRDLSSVVDAERLRPLLEGVEGDRG